MEILVTYDVATEDKSGEKRLRKMAKACEAYGQRVQKSVFECTITQVQMEQFVHRLRKIMNEEKDSLRIYRLPTTRSQSLQVIGKNITHDLHDPLVV